jgi:hypothetical protein
LNFHLSYFLVLVLHDIIDTAFFQGKAMRHFGVEPLEQRCLLSGAPVANDITFLGYKDQQLNINTYYSSLTLSGPDVSGGLRNSIPPTTAFSFGAGSAAGSLLAGGSILSTPTAPEPNTFNWNLELQPAAGAAQR